MSNIKKVREAWLNKLTTSTLQKALPAIEAIIREAFDFVIVNDFSELVTTIENCAGSRI